MWASTPLQMILLRLPKSYNALSALFRSITLEPLGGNPTKKEFWSPLLKDARRNWQLEKLNICLWAVVYPYQSSTFESSRLLSLHFQNPKRNCSRNWNLQKQFLWRGNSESKPHPIKCDTVARPKEKGGLGIGCIFQRNQALLGKW